MSSEQSISSSPQGEAQSIRLRAEAEADSIRLLAQAKAESTKMHAAATADGLRSVAGAVSEPGGRDAVTQRLAEKYVAGMSEMAKVHLRLCVITV